MIRHVAIIPDGNRRWAKRRNISPSEGHRIGVKTVERIFEKAFEMGIPYLTFWGASYDNLVKRSKREVDFLIKLINQEFQKLIKDGRIHQNRVKVRVLGQFKKFLPQKTLKLIEKLMEKTEKYEIFNLTFLLAYNGTDEIVEAVKKILKVFKRRTIKITANLIKNYLWTKDLPPVDLVIRTGCEGDPHNSAGFMMWHTAYSQYYFTKTLFPDFTPQEFEKAIRDYLKREKRKGA